MKLKSADINHQITMKPARLLLLLLFIVGYQYVFSRRHILKLDGDTRKSFALSTFGFLKGGGLMVEVQNFTWSCNKKCGGQEEKFGFSLEKTTSDGVSSYVERNNERCVLKDQSYFQKQKQIDLMLFTFNTSGERVEIERIGDSFKNILVTNGSTPDEAWSFSNFMTSFAPELSERLKEIVKLPTKKFPNTTGENAADHQHALKNTREVKKIVKFLPFYRLRETYFGRITILIQQKEQEGLYNLYFHNCANYLNKGAVRSHLKLKIIEHNIGTFLSAGEIHLPLLYGLISLMFFITGCIWVSYLREHREWTFKVHHLMAVLVFLKSFSVTFHAVNYYYIGRDGRQMETWAVLYYLTHLLKGALLFTTIVLIGTGFFFVKHVLSKKEKRIFMVVIPLQILANVAQIMLESTEEGRAEYSTWIFILVDLICCGAILFPVIWSIRHLQESSQTDGKAAISLAKLKLFRHFYVMIVCYIYFTRIIVYLIKITVPYKFMWLDQLCTEFATFAFFVMTGYNFRPTPTNPYLHVPSDDEDTEEIELQEISTNIGIAEGLKRVNPGGRKQAVDTV